MTSDSSLIRPAPSPRLDAFRQTVRPGLALLGVAAMISGSFLPWILSGRNPKNSYQIAGAAERYLPEGNEFLGSALTLWPWQGPIWAVIVVLFLIGLHLPILRRIAAVIAFVFALALGAVAVGVLIVGGQVTNNWITVHSAGPIVTVIGSVITMTATAMITLRRQNRRNEVFDRHSTTS